MLLLAVGALVAGVLTTLAPCVLPVLPVVLGGAVAPRPAVRPLAAAVRVPGAPAAAPAPPTPSPDADERRRPLVVVASLGVSVVVFTLVLKASTAFVGVPTSFWQLVSGGVLALLGLDLLLPQLWQHVAAVLHLREASSGALARSRDRGGVLGAALTGAALGPVFSSCSPTYAYVVATVLPAAPAQGLVLLLLYVAGLCGTLLVVALAGRRAVAVLRRSADPRGVLRRAVGVLLLVVGLAVATGVSRDAETWLVEHNPLEALLGVDASFVPGR
ncbi:MAG TPA: hypothetical protein VE781_17475 [Kineosporiaceae bacterium]|nr:hypothetical protein [Kineosporiaceae bacterium]